jgi:hypothetical protein
LEDTSLARKYYTREEVTDSDKIFMKWITAKAEGLQHNSLDGK